MLSKCDYLFINQLLKVIYIKFFVKKKRFLGLTLVFIHKCSKSVISDYYFLYYSALEGVDKHNLLINKVKKLVRKKRAS